ncbi:hypothetical protein [Desulfofalx alkaliphila]|uniref:hypothetical protein n=1 Tax=Desulfofalx alkaliphila TaxID=105483 RepID=UPI00068DB2D1|nr:hypothetical protein [Desulfofalx alkaliphila]
MNGRPQIHIETPKEEKDKLIKWYGWITILVICITPLVLVFLPLLMLNTSKINKMLKESRVPEVDWLSGRAQEVNFGLKNEDGVDSVQGEIIVQDEEGQLIKCTFLKYVGKDTKILPEIKESNLLEITGKMDKEDKVFLIRNVRVVETEKVYTTEPVLSVY